MSKDKQAQEKAKKTVAKRTQKSTDKRLKELEEQVEQLTADVKRERADFMNYKRRSELDRLQIMQVAKQDIMGQLLPLFDDLERALSAMPDEIADNPWAKGVAQVHRQVQSRLNDLGVSRIECVGQPFDPELHEAVGFEDGEGAEEVVTEELRPGYRIDQSVLRPSMVRVGKVDSKDINNKEQNNG